MYCLLPSASSLIYNNTPQDRALKTAAMDHVSYNTPQHRALKTAAMDHETLSNSLAMMQFEYDDGDLFNAPISAEACMEATAQNENENAQLAMEADMALYEMCLQDPVLLYECVDTNKPCNLPQDVSNCTTELTSIEEVVSDSEPQGHGLMSIQEVVTTEMKPMPPLPKRPNANDASVLGSEDQVRENAYQNQRKIQRSLSSHELGQFSACLFSNQNFPCYDTSPTFRGTQLNQGKPSLQFSDFEGTIPMRRVYSTGDIKGQVQWTPLTESGDRSLFPSETNSLTSEDKEFKIGQYTVEERKERIHRYRKKRNERNFNRKIKYACRKSLADNQPRIRGRFAPKTEEVARSNTNGSLHLEKRKGEVVFVC